MAKWTTCRMIRRCREHCSRLVVLSAVIAGICLTELDVAASPQLLGSHYRADVPYPQFARFWSDNCLLGEDWAESIGRTIPRATTLGGSAHLFIRNDDPQPLTITDVTLQGISLREAIAFSDQRRLRKSYKEMANALGCKIKSIDNALSRIRRKLPKVAPEQAARLGRG